MKMCLYQHTQTCIAVLLCMLTIVTCNNSGTFIWQCGSNECPESYTLRNYTNNVGQKLFEERYYSASTWAMGPGFWPLFNFIKKNKITMTTPVIHEYHTRNSKTSYFYIGKNDRRDNNNQYQPYPGVNVIDLPATTYYVIDKVYNGTPGAGGRFTFPQSNLYTSMKTDLKGYIDAAGLSGTYEADSSYNYNVGYDSPWGQWNRRNEVWIKKTSTT